MRYQYCSACGKKLHEKQAGDDGDVPFCTLCNKYWFGSFASCVIVLVYNEYNEIVLCRQGYLSDRYTSFTSGYITPGETAEEAAIREIKEELGLGVQTLTCAGAYWFAQREQLMHGFLGYLCSFRRCIDEFCFVHDKSFFLLYSFLLPIHYYSMEILKNPQYST